MENYKPVLDHFRPGKGSYTLREPLNTEKLYIAIRQAVNDLKSAVEDPYLDVDMMDWMSLASFSDDGSPETCSVCLAGAAMAYRLDDEQLVKYLKSPYGVVFPPKSTSGRLGYVFPALDAVRCGCWSQALYLFYEENPNFKIPEKLAADVEALKLHYIAFKDNPDEFLDNMCVLADLFEKYDV